MILIIFYFIISIPKRLLKNLEYLFVNSTAQNTWKYDLSNALRLEGTCDNPFMRYLDKTMLLCGW